MADDQTSEEAPNIDPEDLPDDGGVEVEKGYGTSKDESRSDGEN